MQVWKKDNTILFECNIILIPIYHWTFAGTIRHMLGTKWHAKTTRTCTYAYVALYLMMACRNR